MTPSNDAAVPTASDAAPVSTTPAELLAKADQLAARYGKREEPIQ